MDILGGLVVAALFLFTLVGIFDAALQARAGWQDSGQSRALWVILQVVLGPVGAAAWFFYARPKVAGAGAARLEAQAHAAETIEPGTLLLQASDLVAGYVPGVNILNGCDLRVDAGELVGIIGPNGAGKSTMLKALFGLIPVREGTATLRGEDITGLSAHQLVSRGIGYVPQNENVFSNLTVAENLEMGMYLRPKDVAERMDFVCELFPLLAERRRQRAGSLSGGERQMLAMARALMMEPSVLLLDEPSAGLSPVFQDEVFIRCAQINRAGVSIIMVEQNARRCLEICHRGYVLDQGRNAYTDTGEELLGDPKVIELYLGTLAKAR